MRRGNKDGICTLLATFYPVSSRTDEQRHEIQHAKRQIIRARVIRSSAGCGLTSI